MPDASLPSLRKTAKRSTLSGHIRSYPTLDDLIEYAINMGWVATREEVLDHRTGLIPRLFFYWIASGQVACQFAVRLAREWRRAEWEPYLVDAIAGTGTILAQVDEILAARLEKAEAIQVLLPQVTTAADIVDVIDELCASPRWFWREQESDDPNIFNVGLRWVFPDDKHVAWPLGFADLETSPYTRRAPFTSIALRPSVVDENQIPPQADTDDRTPVHFARMKAIVPEGEQVYEGATWQRTHKNRMEILNTEGLKGGRARVTFSLPSSVRARLQTQPHDSDER